MEQNERYLDHPEPKKVAPFLREDFSMSLQQLPYMKDKQAFLNFMMKMKPMKDFKIDESSVEVRCLGGQPGNELAAVVTYRVTSTTEGGSVLYNIMATWSKMNGEWQQVSRMGYLEKPLSEQDLKNIVYNHPPAFQAM
eukprot:TRINITY_DN9669_c1_g1_i1.p1 TRINITY_DN9669_c1_g1~~TRINITY_DN9669_c1_g1_i1.p1  ORF type:complete len:138 (+),score=24.94 TRINITY_DN9669_c1_g1_i1:296-709(+)